MAEDYRIECCTLGMPEHPGPCVWFCSLCAGTGRCPDCGGNVEISERCELCDSTGACPYCGGRGEVVDELPDAGQPVETLPLPGVS